MQRPARCLMGPNRRFREMMMHHRPRWLVVVQVLKLPQLPDNLSSISNECKGDVNVACCQYLLRRKHASGE